MGGAGPALVQRRSIATTVERKTRSPRSKLVPAWSPGEERALHRQDAWADPWTREARAMECRWEQRAPRVVGAAALV